MRRLSFSLEPCRAIRSADERVGQIFSATWVFILGLVACSTSPIPRLPVFAACPG